MSIPLDYETLRLIWWLLLGVLLIGFAIMDGFDLGVGDAAALRRAAPTPSGASRINTIGPVWEGNQVWLILGGGAIFAAWPPLYAAAFSGFYIAMFLVLVALILRPVGFKFRSKIADPRWRTFWDWALFVGGLRAVAGVRRRLRQSAAGRAVPLRWRPARAVRGRRAVRPAQSVRPAVRAGLGRHAVDPRRRLSRRVKTDGAVKERAAAYVRIGALVTVALFVLGGVWVAFGLDGYAITSAVIGRRPLQSAAQDGRAGARRLARQLRRASAG